MNRTIFIILLLITFFIINGCEKDEPCTCVGRFKFVNGIELLVPDVDCETGAPGVFDQSTLTPVSANFLGCDANTNQD